METISAPTRPVDAVRDAAREQRIAALAARRNPAATQRTTARPAVGPTGRDAVDARLAALADRRPPTRPGAAPAGRTKRRHAAKGARALSLGLSLASTGGLAAFFAMSNAEAGTQLQAATIVAAPAAPAASQTAAPSPTVVALSVPGVTATATPAAVPVPVAATPTTAPATVAPAPAASNTIVQGGVFHNKWGDVQVQATFAADGTLVDVVTLQTPDRDGKSVRINDSAVPQLNSEALTSQTAQVDTVSGATYTSTDYRNSLQSAIDAARAAGLTAIA
jgi:uncharacterized protein with FMN-binding domain